MLSEKDVMEGIREIVKRYTADYIFRHFEETSIDAYDIKLSQFSLSPYDPLHVLLDIEKEYEVDIVDIDEMGKMENWGDYTIRKLAEYVMEHMKLKNSTDEQASELCDETRELAEATK